MKKIFLLLAVSLGFLISSAAYAEQAGDPLENGWKNPPIDARLRAYWWWLNGNINKDAITKDLEWMKSIGMGGGLIFDAGGASQGGHAQVPAGPLYGSPEWRELFRHALKEADRLGLELTLSAQSGWNLGGPCVKPENSSKHITWSELEVVGPTNISVKLHSPKNRNGFYADSFVLAYRRKDAAAGATCRPDVKASSTQPGAKIEAILDGNDETFWVSKGAEEGHGPTKEKPEWIQFDFAKEVTLSGAEILGRPGYGPKDCEWQLSEDGKKFRKVDAFSVKNSEKGAVKFSAVTASHFRLVISSSYDPKMPKSPRNVQVSEIKLLGGDGKALMFNSSSKPIRQLEAKCVFGELGGSAPDCSGLLDDIPGTPGEADVKAADVVDLSSKMDRDGNLQWACPQGAWQVLRFGYTVSGGHVSTASGSWQGLVVDYLDAGALKSYWAQVVEPLLEDAGPLAGKVLKGFQTDSWEGGGISWTLRMPEEFLRRRGYDLKPYLPVFAGRIVEDREVSNRFLNDFRRTVADCMADNHYGVMRDLAGKSGMYIHCEAAGPHAGPFDGLKNLGRCERPMGEFWVQSPHRPNEDSRYFTKVASSAAHTYGKKIACAEGFTSIGPQWDDVIWSSQKPTFDHEACAGMNLVYWHAFTCSPASMGLPGQEYFAGTHFNPQITWAKQAHAFVGYLDRCQYLLQQGLAVADVCVYSGDHVPNIPGRKQQDPAKILPGYDYDVFNEEVLLARMSVKDGRIMLPDGMSYRVMSLPNLKVMSLSALKKMHELVSEGAIIVGPRPERSSSLTGYPACDVELKKLADELWGGEVSSRESIVSGQASSVETVDRRVGRGRVVSGKAVKDVLASEKVLPDFECTVANVQWPVFDPEAKKSNLDYIHRSTAEAEIYFISNQRPEPVSASVVLRAAGNVELWDAVSGQMRTENGIRKTEDGRTGLQLTLEAYGSVFVVLRKQGSEVKEVQGSTVGTNTSKLKKVLEINGSWNVTFDPKWGGPADPVTFEKLEDWTKRPEEGIKYYSGTATYRKVFDLAESPIANYQSPKSEIGNHKSAIYLSLGSFGNVAEVRLNGKNLGVVWAPPFRVDITDAVQAKDNRLEIDVVNSWYNRLVLEQGWSPEKRLTKTNIRLKSGAVPQESGLMGPVTIIISD